MGKRRLIFLITVITVVLAFCGFTTAHPGHGIPEEVTTNQTTDQTTGQSTSQTTVVTTKTENKKIKSNTKSKGSKSDNIESTEGAVGNENSEGGQPVEIVSNTTDPNSDNLSNQFLSLGIGIFIALGLGGIGYFFKGFL